MELSSMGRAALLGAILLALAACQGSTATGPEASATAGATATAVEAPATEVAPAALPVPVEETVAVPEGTITLSFSYDSGVTGTVEVNAATGRCDYTDNWEGGRTGTPSCTLQGGALTISPFKYPGTEWAARSNRLNMVLNDVDLTAGCFSGGSWYWVNPKNSNEWDGDVVPRETSVCPQASEIAYP